MVYKGEKTVTLSGHLRYGTAVVEVEAETKEEAKIKIQEAFEDSCYDIIDVDYEIDGVDFEEDTTITKKEEN